MKSLKEATGALTWIRNDAAGRDFVLRSGSDQFATLSWAKETGSLAGAATEGESWTFKRVGFFQPYISIRAPRSDRNVGRVELLANGSGAVQFADVERYLWSGNLWRSEWTWNTPSGSLLVSFRRDFSIDDRAGQVVIPPEHLHTIHLPLLVILGWYIIVSMGDESEK